MKSRYLFTLLLLFTAQLSFTQGDPLPVDWISFKVIQQGDSVVLKWVVIEENNAYFNAERSTDGKSWEPIVTIEGLGTTYFEHTYHFTDYPDEQGLIYYRVKQTDFDEQYSFSKMESLLFGGKIPLQM